MPGFVHEQGCAARRTRRRHSRRSRAAPSRLRRRGSPAPGRSSAARLPAISAITAITSSTSRCRATGAGPRRARRACTRSRRSGPGCRTGAPSGCSDPIEIARRGRRASAAPAAARSRRQVLLLAGPVGGIGGDERIGRHDTRTLAVTARPRTLRRARGSSPNWIESSSACHDASMMFSFTPIVVQVCSPSVESISTRVTAPVPLLRVEHAHLVVGEVHTLERREPTVERAPQRAVERVHRAVALRGRDAPLAVDVDLHRRLGHHGRAASRR